jgi:hypothetical protein
MKLVGKTRPGGTAFEIGSDTKRVARYQFPQPCRIVKLSIYVDGQGSGSGDQVMRGVIYDATGNLVATGDEVRVLDGQAAGWVDLPFASYPGGVQIAAGALYDLGVLGGANTNSIRAYGDDPGSGVLTGALPLTVASGNEITDTTRAAGVEGDPALRENLIANPNFESGLWGWIQGASASAIAADPTRSFQGGQSMKITALGSGGGALTSTTNAATLSLIVGQVYTFSMYVYLPSSWTGGQVTVSASGFGLTGNIANGLVNMALRDQWQRVSVTFTPLVALGLVGMFYINPAPAAGQNVWIDAVQLEHGTTASPYADRTISGYRFVTNLVTNGDFETGVSGWQSFLGATFVQSNVHAWNGQYAMRMTTPGAVPNEGVSSATAARFPVRYGQTYTISYRVYSAAGGEVVAGGIDQLLSDGTYVTSAGIPTWTLLPGWNYVVGTVTLAGMGVALGSMYLRTRGSGAAQAIDVWIDAVQIEVGALPHDFVPTNGTSAAAMQGVADSTYGLYAPATNLVRNGAARVDLTNWVVANYSVPSNLVTNPDFVTNTTGWAISGTGTLFTRDTGKARFGGASGKVATGGGNFDGAFFANMAGTAGTSYGATGWVFAATGLPLKIMLEWHDAANALLSSIQTTFTGNGQWQKVSVAGTAPASTAKLTVTFYLNNSAQPAGTNFWVSGVTVEPGTLTPTGFASDARIVRFTGDGPFNTGIDFSITESTGWGSYLANNLYLYPGGFVFDTSKRYTLSFYARASSSDTSFIVHIGDSTSTNEVMRPVTYTTPTDGQWHRYVIPFDPLHAGTQPVVFFGSADKGAHIRLTGVQIETHDYATPYKDTPSSGTATRNGIDVELPSTLLDSRTGSAFFRIRPSWPSSLVDTKALTVTGFPVTDRDRELRIDGDGLGYPATAYGIYGSRTNLLLNGGAETNLANIGQSGLNSPGVWVTQPVVGAGTGLTGTFIYRVSAYVSNVNGNFESPTNAATASVSPANQDVVVTLAPLQNGDATGRKLYRSSDGGTTWKLVATLPGFPVTTYTDNVPDASLTTVTLPNFAPPANGQALITRSTAFTKFGTNAFSVATPGAVNSEGMFGVSATVSDTTGSVVGSCWVFQPTGTLQFRAWVRITYSDGTILDGGATIFTPSSGGTRVVTPAVAVSAGKTATSYQLMVRSNALGATTIYVDGMQVERGTVATPYVHTDGATATKGGVRIQMSNNAPTGAPTPTQGQVSVRVRPAWAFDNAPSSFARVWVWALNGESAPRYSIDLYYDQGSNRWAASVIENGVTVAFAQSAAQNFAAGATINLTMYWTATSIGLSVNGANFTTGVRSANNPGTWDTFFEIGQLNNAQHFYGDVLWAEVGAGTPINSDAAAWAALSSSSLAIGLWSFGAAPRYFWGADGPNYNVAGAPDPFPSIFDWGQDNDNELLIFYDTTNKNWQAGRDVGGNTSGRPAVAGTHAAGDSLLVGVYWTPTQLAISLNGGAFVVVSNTNLPTLTPTTFFLGRRSWTAGGYLDGDIQWASFASGIPTDADAAALYALGSADPTFAQLPAAPVALWSASSGQYVTSQSGMRNSDTYSDGPSAMFGASTPLDYDLSIYATYTNYRQALPDEDDFYYARLPFERAQLALDTGKVESGSLHTGTLGWHGNRLDPERGSFVIVDSDGPLADLVGERLRITVGRDQPVPRSVVAYCHTMAALASDLSLPRRLYLALGAPGDETPAVQVEVLE